MSSPMLSASGKLPALRGDNLTRLAVYLVQGSTVLAETPVGADGTFRFALTEVLAGRRGVAAVVGPRGLDHHVLLQRTELPRVPLRAEPDRKSGHITLDFSKFRLSDEIIDPWWIWCWPYTVSGTLSGADGCPVPGADVTVYTVTHGISGLVKTARETVHTDASGFFTATFNWCRCHCCWPCWPFWWNCWPWWWELDIEHVLGRIERALPQQTARGIRVPAQQSTHIAPFARPHSAALMTGQGFAAARNDVILEQDSDRTARIASKLADVRIRELFPWWWWCCDEPNIVFSATQAGNLIFDEDPNTSTRWCFAGGQTVSLVANAQAITLCGGPAPPEEGFTWTQVGDTHIDHITQGYANGTPGSDASDMAFAGTLSLYGAFADPGIPLYQVTAGFYGGNKNPRRGGSAPVTASPISTALSASAFIFRAATSTVDVIDVGLGPCSLGALDNLYVLPNHRQHPPAGLAGLLPFPAMAPGDFVIAWSDAGRLVYASASALIGGAAVGGVDLTAVAYHADGTPVTLVTDVPLTLMIDSTSIGAHIDTLTAYDQFNNPVPLTTSATEACPSYKIGPHGYVQLHVTVTDANGHLYQYKVETEFGHGSTSVPTAPSYRGYAQAPGSFTGVDVGYVVPNVATVTFGGGGDTIRVTPAISCCYDFRLNAGKRVTDGRSFFSTWGNYDFWTASIDVSP